MHRDVLERLPELRELRKTYNDSIAKDALDEFPTPRRKKPPRRGKAPAAPKNKVGFAKTFAAGWVRQVTPVRDLSREHPEANVAHLDLKWWLLAAARLGAGVVGRRHDGVVVPARPRAVPRPRSALGDDPCPAGQGVAGAVEAVQGGAAGPGLAEGVGRDVRCLRRQGRARSLRSRPSSATRCGAAGLHGRAGRRAARATRRPPRSLATRRRRRCAGPRPARRSRR